MAALRMFLKSLTGRARLPATNICVVFNDPVQVAPGAMAHFLGAEANGGLHHRGSSCGIRQPRNPHALLLLGASR